jgi:hypothetical protein
MSGSSRTSRLFNLCKQGTLIDRSNRHSKANHQTIGHSTTASVQHRGVETSTSPTPHTNCSTSCTASCESVHHSTASPSLTDLMLSASVRDESNNLSARHQFSSMRSSKAVLNFRRLYRLKNVIFATFQDALNRANAGPKRRASLELLDPGAHFDLKGPSVSRLPQNVQICLGNSIGVERAVR